MGRIILTGAPGTGKSSVIAALQTAGVQCVPEMARLVLSEQRSSGGRGTGEQDPALFVQLMLDRCLSDFQETEGVKELVVFDRGLPDLLTYAEIFGTDDDSIRRACDGCRYHAQVFICPPWEAIFENDEERRMPFRDVPAFDGALRKHYQALGYDVIDVPCAAVKQRAEFILRRLPSGR